MNNNQTLNFCILDSESFTLQPNETFSWFQIVNLCPWRIKGFTINQPSHFCVVLEEPYLHFIPLEASILQSFCTKGLELKEKRKPRNLFENCQHHLDGSYNASTSMKKQKKASQPVINLIYENNTTGLKHPTVQPLILLSCSLGSYCYVWYGELWIVLLYHLNVISAKHWEHLRSCTLTEKRQESVFFTSFRKKYYLVDRFFPVGEDVVS